MALVRKISNPKLELEAELHSHRLDNPPKGTPAVRFYCTVNNERPAASEMRDTEDEAVIDAKRAIGLPVVDDAPAAPPADAGAASSPA